MNFFSPIILVLSYVLILTSGLTTPEIILASGEGERPLSAFLVTGGLCLFLSLLGFFVTRQRNFAVSSKQLYLITVSSWSGFCLIGAIPLYLALPDLSFTDSFFESMSGITTTGSTVLTGLDAMPHSILLWRGILQWIGGIGIIVLGIAILPFLRVGGMRLFATESSDWSGKTLPRAQVIIRRIGFVYIIFTLLASAAYWLAGMNLFDAVVHAMTTLATGGYANYDTSMGHFDSQPAILWVGTFFMLLGSLPFMLYLALLRGNPAPLFSDQQVRGYVAFVIVIVCFLTIERMTNTDVPLGLALTRAAFNVVSIVTTTGFATEDYTQWGSWAIVVFFFLMFVGGCSGSTAGSFKFFRFQIAAVLLRNQLRIMRHPNAIFTSKFNTRVVTDDIIRSIIGFSFFFAITIALLTLCLSLTGLDFITSLSAAATAVANVGPGIGDTVGPAGNFASLPDTTKWLLCLGMLLGRLEIMTLIVLFTPTFWKT
jgi:trk system potassium uptake protein TrkH